MSYRTLAEPWVFADEPVKGSRFVALAAPIADEAAFEAVLEEARTRWPDEPTWDLTAADLLAEADPARALAVAQRGHEVAWGDNRLRTAHTVASALIALDRADEAAAVIDAALAEAPTPDEGLSVRTHRYRERLEKLRPGSDSE